MNEFQQNIAFEKNPNPLKEAMDNGKFIFLAETSLPDNEHRLEEAVERITPLAEAMAKQQNLCGGLAVSDVYGAPWSAADIAAKLPAEIRNNNIYYVSGSGRTRDDIRGLFNIMENAGVKNVVHVSGNADDLSARECRMRNFCSSNAQLGIASNHPAGLMSGVVFNPFYYDKNTVLASYNALEKKVASGAQFVVSQSGWDMLQNQALAWYMFTRKLYLPMIAHLTLLSADKVEKIIAGKVPGVQISPAFRKLLERELSGSKAQFESAQYRRIELQCAGCRLMGYGGVQISGVDYPGKAQIIASRIRSALQEFRSFEHWLDEYNAHQAGAEMSGGIDRFHMFDRVLRRDYPFDEPPQISNAGGFRYSWLEKKMYALKHFMFSKADIQRPGRDFIIKKILAGCCGCSKCSLPQNNFICIENCPKHLDNGPCGEINGNGTCKTTSSECVFVQKLRCAKWREEISCLESEH